MADFYPRKKRVAVYFNNGEFAFSMWAKTDGVEGKGRARLVAAVNAARERFNEVYFAKPPKPESRPGLTPDEGLTAEGLTKNKLENSDA